MEHYNEREAYKRAKKKVKEIKGFYYNLLCYCIVIPILIFVNLKFSPEFQWFWFSMVGWGTGVLFHGLSAFNVVPFLGSDWEDRKLREFVQKEENSSTFKNHKQYGD
ncbi:2TM domain-containing protein [Flavobacterium sp. RHBU_24]|uniref:2TM domain-containing protein n=1 Tax=Flavobacterium sp. RHBU_24 TaxID=3391185 RepID=UPI0039854763